MKYKAYGHRAPKFISTCLFGDREKFGLIPDEADPSWQEWIGQYHNFYQSTQKAGVGEAINDAGYRILRKVSFEGCRILDVGPGGLHHMTHWQGKPSFYALVDLDEKFLATASSKLDNANVSHDLRLTSRGNQGRLPASDSEFDLIVSFYSLEHLYPFSTHLDDMLRVLKPGGKLVGAIPAEGGLAWGLGRFMTSRRWLKNNTSINPDKIICWEHPTLADEILSSVSNRMESVELNYWPTRLPIIDCNLIIKFVFQKPR